MFVAHGEKRATLRDLSARAGAGDAPSWGRRARKRRERGGHPPSASPRARPRSGEARPGRRRPWRAPRPSRACRHCRSGPWESPRAARCAPGRRARGKRRATSWRERGRVRESKECGAVRERLAVGRRRGAAATDAGSWKNPARAKLVSRVSPLRLRVLSPRTFRSPRTEFLGPGFMTREIASTEKNRANLDRQRGSLRLSANTEKLSKKRIFEVSSKVEKRSNRRKPRGGRFFSSFVGSETRARDV